MQLHQGALLQGGKFRIDKMLGQGGFGITYLGTQVALNRHVAIKEFFMKEYCERDASTSQVSLGSSGSREMVARFRNKFIKEAQTIANLSHPHIIRIHDIFEENGTAYYVMEYVEGGSLNDLVKDGTPLSEPVAVEYVKQIASALHYIHKEKILHLDVKPANILMRDTDDVVLIDFGISKHYDEEGHQTSSSPAGISKGYAPLEQYNQGLQTFTPATDVYSLAATLYKLLTGQTPPEASIINEDGLPPLPVSWSADLRKAVEKGMAPRKKDRVQTIEEFLTLLPTQGTAAAETEETEIVEETAEEETLVETPKETPEKSQTPPKEKEEKEKPKKEKKADKPINKKRNLIAWIVLGVSVLIHVFAYYKWWINDFESPLFPHYTLGTAIVISTLASIVAACMIRINMARTIRIILKSLFIISVAGSSILSTCIFFFKARYYSYYAPGEWLVVTLSGQISWLDKFPDDIFPACKNGKWGLINGLTGEIIAPYKYDDIYLHGTQNGARIVEKDNKYGLINTQGEIILPIEYTSIYYEQEGAMKVMTGEWGNRLYGFADTNGKLIIPPVYEDAHNTFADGLVGVKKDGKWGFVNKNNETVIPFIYKKAIGFSFNHNNQTCASVTTFDDKEYYINKRGQRVN